MQFTNTIWMEAESYITPILLIVILIVLGFILYKLLQAGKKQNWW